MERRKIWRLAEPDYARAHELSRELQISRIGAEILKNRKLASLEEMRLFLTADRQCLQDPFRMPGIREGAAKLYGALENNERIVVFGDYDVDGITATALLTGLLRRLGGQVCYYIPSRLTEGYGLNKQALLAAKEEGAGLAVTVDCGIASCEEAAYAKEIGLELVITDHHQPPLLLPHATVLINPKTAAGKQPWSDLAGVGVAYKLAQALAIMAGREDLADEYLDLVALGTIADIVPLLSENRILVNAGLALINKGTRPGIAALLKVSGLGKQEVTSQQIAYTLAPRLNAFGRISQADTAVELLLTDSPEAAAQMAAQSQAENQTRQALEADILEGALNQAEKALDLANDKVFLLASAGWHPGVIGIVASRLVDRYYRPTIIVALDEGVGKGSARSIPGFSIYQALEAARDSLVEFGGHEMAAGLTVREDKIEELRAALNAYAARELDEKALLPVLNIDAEIGAGEISRELIGEIERFAPFGADNPRPLLVLRGARPQSCKQVGAGGKHLKIQLAAAGLVFEGIAFNLGEVCAAITDWSGCDVAFTPEINSFNGRTQIQLNIKDIKSSEVPDNPFAVPSFLDNLYAEGELWLEDDCYRDILDREEFFTKAVGVSFANRQETIRAMEGGEAVRLVRDRDNEHDPNAVSVFFRTSCLGYLNARLAKRLAAACDNGVEYEAYVTQITGRDKETAGVNLCIRRRTPEGEGSGYRAQRERLAALPEEQLAEEIKKVLLGNHDYHEKQKEALSGLKESHNSLVVFATGRGKSAVFQTMAAYLALTKRQITIIVYPLRSLVNDQFQRTKEKMAELGLQAAAVNGSAGSEQKTEFFRSLRQGNIDIILTTPEFLDYHADKFGAVAERIGLLAVDEAHHLGRGRRKGYRLLAANWRKLGKPLALAVTATADDETAAKIIASLECSRVVIEEYERSNFYLADRREEKDKLAYLLRLIAQDERTVIYVNSRKQAYQLARELRSYYPPAREEIAFYHGGLSSEYRRNIEEMFRRKELRVVMTTSAFGEGIDIPDIRHVVLYHLCFSRTEFNQLAGRAGRDGLAAGIHVLFGDKDKQLNEFILESAAPSREVLGKLYLYLREQAEKQNPLRLTNHQISEAMQQRGIRNFQEQTVSAGLAVFEELGIVLREVEGGSRYIHFVPPLGKLDLNDSVRFLEGLGEWEEFQEFAAFVLGEKEESILAAVNKPILPASILNEKSSNQSSQIKSTVQTGWG